MVAVHLDHVTRRFEPTALALAGLDLRVGDGELVSIVGPSGCGKTTALRLLAGFDKPDSGHVVVDGMVVDDLSPRERGVGMVTDGDTMLPGATARRNIAFPLRVRARPGAETALRVELEAANLQIGHLLDRRRGQLSAGERQAVQVARALVAHPRYLLLDEPFMRIDPALGARLRRDLATLRRDLHITTVLATADQADAMSLSDRVAVVDNGRLQQVGTPSELYSRPVNTMVAGFLGEPGMNLVDVAVEAAGDQRWFRLGSLRVRAYPEVVARYVGRTVTLGIRPEHVVVGDRSRPGVDAAVLTSVSRGQVEITELGVGARRLSVLHRGTPLRSGSSVPVRFEPRNLHLFDTASGAALHHPA